jgi:hypothetical protein
MCQGTWGAQHGATQKDVNKTGNMTAYIVILMRVRITIVVVENQYVLLILSVRL